MNCQILTSAAAGANSPVLLLSMILRLVLQLLHALASALSISSDGFLAVRRKLRLPVVLAVLLLVQLVLLVNLVLRTRIWEICK